jgi:hypothetical protein
MSKTSMKIAQLLNRGLSPEKIAELVGCSLNNVYYHRRVYDSVTPEVEKMLRSI